MSRELGTWLVGSLDQLLLGRVSTERVAPRVMGTSAAGLGTCCRFRSVQSLWPAGQLVGGGVRTAWVMEGRQAPVVLRGTSERLFLAQKQVELGQLAPC